MGTHIFWLNPFDVCVEIVLSASLKHLVIPRDQKKPASKDGNLAKLSPNEVRLKMRLLTHNVMRNNASAASSSTSPPRITAATKVRVDESAASASDGGDDAAASRREVEFARHVLPILDWESLVQAASAMGLMSLPPSVSTDLAEDEGFLRALYHVLMNVHLVDGMLTCEVTGREFPVTDGIVNMMLEEHECE